MPSFGEKLKLEREKRKITLEQISSTTKIGTRMLQALEEDKFNQLPGGIFNKGFVRAYSRCVGLDEDQTVAEYLEASGDAPPVSTEIVAPEDEGREDAGILSRLEASNGIPARQLPWGWFAAVLLVVALALSFWSHSRWEHQRPPVQPTATTTAPSALATPPPGEVSGGVSGNAKVPGAPSAVSPSQTTGSAAGGPAKPAAPRTSQDLTPAVPAAVPGEFTVVIQAHEESWISIIADGRTVSSELLPAGGERAVHGRKEIIVKAGNVGGVDFQFNGQKLKVGGESGEVKTVTFGPRGILPNAPAAPSTP
ncbi:MAG: DUF4115 domain-containing protein [Acidobacteriia bacterium]|nr:DUF4115 domain-containing protein [Terriglobia bacterium]